MAPKAATTNRALNRPRSYKSMELVTEKDYLRFVGQHRSVMIGDVEIAIGQPWNIGSYAPPASYVPESFTVWSFPDRGDWATHTGKYRGNWSPYIPRNLILKYTQAGDTVLDQMAGSGTTLVECKLLQRNGIGVDINPDAVMLVQDRLNFAYNPLLTGSEPYVAPKIETYVGDARNLDKIPSDSIDLIATHPPYAFIIKYTKQKVEGDLSSTRLDEYINSMKRVASESFRVLKPGKNCGVLIGDSRAHQHYIPISIGVLEAFRDAGFILREDIIKLQHHTKTTRDKWKGRYDFYKIAHEHLFVFRKPLSDEKVAMFRDSVRWPNEGFLDQLVIPEGD